MKKIDIHCHTTNRLLENTIDKKANIKTILKKMKKHNIETTYILPTYFAHKGSGITNFRLLNWINKHSELKMFGSLDFEHYFYQGINEIKELANLKKISGIKIYTGYQNIDFSSEKFKKIINIANNFSLPLMFHTGFVHGGREKYKDKISERIIDIMKLEPTIKKNPNLTFILSHMGKPHLNKTISLIQKYKNVYTDMSGLIDSKYEQHEIPRIINKIKKFLKEIGPNKLLFGTDFPVQTYEDSIRFIEESTKDFPLDYKKKIYYGNARKILK